MTSRCQSSGARTQAQAAPHVSSSCDRQVTSLTRLPQGRPVRQTTLIGKAHKLASALACFLRVQQTVVNQLQHRHVLHARLQEKRPVAAWIEVLPPSWNAIARVLLAVHCSALLIALSTNKGQR